MYSFLLQYKNKRGKQNYKTMIDIQRGLKIWKISNLTLEGKFVIFQTIAVSKIVFDHL